MKKKMTAAVNNNWRNNRIIEKIVNPNKILKNQKISKVMKLKNQ